MTKLRLLLESDSHLLKRLNVVAPEPVHMRRAATTLKERIGGTAPDALTTAAIQSRTLAAFNDNGLDAISPRELRDACKVILSAPSPPGRHPQLGPAIVALVKHRQVRPPLLALIAAYLDRFAANDADVARLAVGLQGLVETWQWRSTDKWRERSESFALFQPNEAPKRLAAAIIAAERGPPQVLAQAGLDTDVRMKGGFAEAAFREACVRCSGMVGGAAARTQTKLIAWARDGKGELSFARAWPELFSALMSPWESGEPPAEHKTELISLVLNWGGGDPRINSSRKWVAVRDRKPAYGVLMRWLTTASVMQFLDIVDASLDQPADRTMWSYRRAFWTSYLLGGDGGFKIDEAWIAFGRDAADRARRISMRTGDKSFETHGIQTERSDQHSALIMKIRDMTIVDWSHSGKCQIWKRGDPKIPPLYNTKYLSGLYAAPLQEIHSAPRTYAWQKKVAEIIEGRRFYSERSSWRPKRV